MADREMAGREMVGRDAKEAKEWAEMSKKWQESLTTLLNTIDTVNKNRYEVDRQKDLIRRALTEGKYDVLSKERALELNKQWTQGMQMIPLYPEDYASSFPAPTVHLSPIAPMIESEGPLSGYVYELDEGMVAAQRGREWIQVAPPPLIVEQTEPTEQTVFTAIADWRVQPVIQQPMPAFIQPMQPMQPIIEPILEPMNRGFDQAIVQTTTATMSDAPINVVALPAQFVPARVPINTLTRYLTLPKMPAQPQRIYYPQDIAHTTNTSFPNDILL